MCACGQCGRRSTECVCVCVCVCERLGVTMLTCLQENTVEAKATNNKNYQSIHIPHIVSDMDPGERVNMPTFFAFDLTHAGPHSV